MNNTKKQLDNRSQKEDTLIWDQDYTRPNFRTNNGTTSTMPKELTTTTLKWHPPLLSGSSSQDSTSPSQLQSLALPSLSSELSLLSDMSNLGPVEEELEH